MEQNVVLFEIGEKKERSGMLFVVQNGGQIVLGSGVNIVYAFLSFRALVNVLKSFGWLCYERFKAETFTNVAGQKHWLVDKSHSRSLK